eukprot:7030342-Pyramimonas_sp.AAC.1
MGQENYFRTRGHIPFSMRAVMVQRCRRRRAQGRAPLITKASRPVPPTLQAAKMKTRKRRTGEEQRGQHDQWGRGGKTWARRRRWGRKRRRNNNNNSTSRQCHASESW